MIPNLKYLLVADNMVSYISPNSLRNLTDLEFLDFSKNNISILDKSLLEDNIRLNVIKLGSNPISNMPEGFFRITVIEPQGFFGLGLLEHLILTHNNLGEEDPAAFQFSQSLFLLNISYNNLPHLPNVQNLKNLYVIDARDNQIDRLDSNSFTELDYLASLNIFGSKVAYISRNVFRHTPKLQLLQASHNNIKAVESGAFKNSKNLKWIFLTHNKRNDISNVFTEILA
ncbi:unnamed protein product [Mytilus coruscus]|uniref:LINGO n=1 Tax=Mytilus coruscus TaxID=42192 RepID=A0A6J8A6J7_MYTCO|nr:unnamed protein product [Mytilus coruscus]